MDIDRRSTTSSDITRRECLKLAGSAGAMALSFEPLRAITLPTNGRTAVQPMATPAEWTGHNRKLGEYFLEHGYPAYEPHPRYLGELRGSWYQMGRQYGARAGDLIRMVYEG